jgi:hypothetical protein
MSAWGQVIFVCHFVLGPSLYLIKRNRVYDGNFVEMMRPEHLSDNFCNQLVKWMDEMYRSFGVFYSKSYNSTPWITV